MFGAIAGGIASALAGGAMSKLFGGGQKAASGGIQGEVLATDNNTVGMGDAGIKSAIQGSNVPNPDRSEERRVGSRVLPRHAPSRDRAPRRCCRRQRSAPAPRRSVRATTPTELQRW